MDFFSRYCHVTKRKKERKKERKNERKKERKKEIDWKAENYVYREICQRTFLNKDQPLMTSHS